MSYLSDLARGLLYYIVKRVTQITFERMRFQKLRSLAYKRQAGRQKKSFYIVPEEDYLGMKHNGIENPDARKYWEGFNAFFVDGVN